MSRIGISAQVGVENPLLGGEENGQDSLGISAGNTAQPSSADSECNGAIKALQTIQELRSKAHVGGRGHGTRHGRKADMDLS